VAASHVNVGFQTGHASIPDQRLSALGLTRRCVVEVPYFSAAVRCVVGTNLLATVPRQVAQLARDNPALTVVPAPRALTGFRYLMAWHPRLNTASAHQWLRSVLREAAKRIHGR
jgi:DNA-binding transcriptional LysR family regulator